MKVEEKQSIIQAAQAYMEEKGISQNELSKLTGVNVSYLSSMMKGVFTFINSRTGKESDIDDKWFLALAGRIGHKVAKEYWPLVETEQFIDIVKELTEAKETATTRIIVGETGCGKSYTVERFRQAYPQGTYVVTCNQNDSISDLVRKIQKVLKVSFDGSVSGSTASAWSCHVSPTTATCRSSCSTRRNTSPCVVSSPSRRSMTT